MTEGADEPTSRAGTLPLVGGVLALDLCNTSSGRGSEGHRDHLRTAADLLTWALRLCEAVYRLNVALSSGQDPDQADVDVIASLHAVRLVQGRSSVREGGFGWSREFEKAPAATVLGPITASAMALITAADRARLKQCGGHHCGWLFLNTTKSNNRRWSETEVCGNRAKQRRRRARAA